MALETTKSTSVKPELKFVVWAAVALTLQVPAVVKLKTPVEEFTEQPVVPESLTA
jgi:hypothetical protein